MSKVYIAASRRGRQYIIELKTASAAKKTLVEISKLPGLSVGVYGANDLATLRRTQRNLDTTHVYKDTELPRLMRTLQPTH